MKIIKSPDLNSWTKNVTCSACLTSLEIDEVDLFILYRDRHVGKFNVTLVNDIVNYYCVCMACEAAILVQDIPHLIQSRVAQIFPPPIKINKPWYRRLFE